MIKKITVTQVTVILTIVMVITALTASAFRAVEDNNNNNNTQATQTTTNLYVIRAAVVQIDKDLVICEDTNGEAWSFEGADEWVKDDEVILLMNDNNTEEIYDDEIIDVRIDPFAS